LAALSTFIPFSAKAQNDGGIKLGFTVETGVEAQTSPSLRPTGGDALQQAKTALGFSFSTQTRSQTLTVETGVSLRKSQGAARTKVKGGLADPFLALKYSRIARNAALTFAATVRETDFSQERQGALGAPLISGTGKLRNTGAEIVIKLREDAPFGFGFLAAWNDVSYQDGIALGMGGRRLNDTGRGRAQINLRFNLDAVTRLITDLEYRTFREAGVTGAKDSFDIATTLEIGRPLGQLEIRAGYVKTQDGHRLSGFVQGDYALPKGKLITGLGLTRTALGRRYLTGGLRFQTGLNNRAFDLTLRRDVASSDLDDAEQITTNLGILYQIDLTPMDDVQLVVDWSDVKDTRTHQGSSYRVIGVAYGRALTPEAKVNLGIRQRHIRDDITGTARSNEVYLSVTRQFKSRH
jgi:hypothetical protein